MHSCDSSKHRPAQIHGDSPIRERQPTHESSDIIPTCRRRLLSAYLPGVNHGQGAGVSLTGPCQSSHKTFIPTRQRPKVCSIWIRIAFFHESPWVILPILPLQGEVSGHAWEPGGDEGERTITWWLMQVMIQLPKPQDTS